MLKVGELARRSGLTVRTLHHYDEIGLLQPSARSDAGYRLYDRGDVARLHGIQALRHLGLSLADIAGVLAGDNAAPRSLIDRQIHALEREIARATELRGRLALMRDGLIAGTEPDMGDWLETLALMATYGKYFSAAELQRIFQNWKPIEADWLPLKDEVQAAMDRGLAPDAPEIQPLANRWMALMLHWMGGDVELLHRWGDMHRLEPSAQGRNHAPSGAMIHFMDQVVKLRMALIAPYLAEAELRRLGFVPIGQWRALEARVQALLQADAPPHGEAAQQALAAWNALVDQVTGHDAALRARLQAAWAAEPLLQAGSALSAPARDYLARVRAHAPAAPNPEQKA